MQPLQGLRVLDLTRVVSGPFCTMMLGDLGADVIKIEEPRHGDESRGFAPPFIGTESAYYLSVNRNKRGCAIDLKHPQGLQLVRRLAAAADVLVENFRPGTMERLGLGDEQLRAEYPRLVHCAITGFGRTGPDAQRPGYDLVIQGESGVMDITGDADGLPTKVGTSIADLVTGQFATQAVLAALLERQKTGLGQRVDVAMLDCMASLLTFNAGIYFATGESPKRRGNAHPTIAPYESFRASDGWINLAVANDKFWQAFCELVARPDLQADPRFRGAADRVRHRSELVPLISDILVQHPRRYWIEAFRRVGIPHGDIRTVREVCEATQLRERGMLFDMPHPTAGVVRNIANPIRPDDAPLPARLPPPLLGQHTREVLASVAGVPQDELDALERAGAIFQNRSLSSTPQGKQ